MTDTALSTLRRPAALILGVVGLALGCTLTAAKNPGAALGSPARDRTATLLAINDVYRIEGLENGAVGGLGRVRALRLELEAQAPDLLMLHAGDFLFPSFASRMYRGEQMIAAMNLLDGDGAAFDRQMFVVFGNHEFERGKLKDAVFLKGRIESSQFQWLGGNITFKNGHDGRPLVSASNLSRTALVQSGGLKLGIFGITIPTIGIEYVEGFAGEQATARELSTLLRSQGADVVVALTHLPARVDHRLLETLGDAGPDVIVAGHDHEAMVDQVGGRFVLKADADARSANIIRITKKGDGKLEVAHELRRLAGAAPRPDPVVAALADNWQERHAREFCAAAKAGPDCLDEVYGRTRTDLGAEENKIRGSETSLGNWIADRMIDAFKACGARVSFINSGSLRLNRDLKAGTVITRRHIEELFAYATPLYLLRIDGSSLMKVADQSVRGWPGNGSWLQIGGFAYVHNPTERTASDLTWKASGPSRRIAPDDAILAVTGDYVINPSIGDQDGYVMLNQGQIVKECAANGLDLKDLVVSELKAAGPEGIAPRVEGRICQGVPAAPCLALKP